MNTTEIKIIKAFAANLTTISDPMRAAFITCTAIRDEATAKWGEEIGIAAFHTAADTIAKSIREAVAA